MKNIFIIIASALMVASCGTTTQIFTNVLDYRPYTDNGFFISPNPYPEAHQTIGEISITVYPGTKGESDFSATPAQGKQKFGDPVYGGTVNSRNSHNKTAEIMTPESLLEMCVQKAIDMGANGISNFKCDIVYNVTKSQYGVIKSIDHYEVYGLGILIED